jgi:hypothetical protein
LNDQEARRRASDEFGIARAHAINEYAGFEQHLAVLFETLLGAEPQKAFAVFASVLNSQARLKMIERLLGLSHGDMYDTFFDSLSKKLDGLDKERNRIAHWLCIHQIGGGKPFNGKTDIYLAEHPNVFAERKLYKHQLDDFAEKARFYGELIFYFAVHLKYPECLHVAPGKRPWRDVFLEQVSYPPAADHPLSQSRSVR